MKTETELYSILENCGFNISTDTRKNIKGSVFFAIKGENFNGNKFVKEALKNGALLAVTQDKKNKGARVLVVKDTLKALQNIAKKYRETFSIPIIAIGGSNGKTTSKELIRDVLKKEFNVHSTEGSFNNHLGLPISILSMQKGTEIGVFEIGANHPNEHTELLEILKPTHVVVTNNGLDHLEGFGSEKGARIGNAEIYKWAKKNNAETFVNKNMKDLMLDSKNCKRILYPTTQIEIKDETPVTLIYKNKKYKTNLAGIYNKENIELATNMGENFGIKTSDSLNIIKKYVPTLKRSQIVTKNKNIYIVDCYNANPSSMKLSLESFFKSIKAPRGVILGDMLELGKYSEKEHKKILKFVVSNKNSIVILIGNEFKKIINNKQKNIDWFINSEEAGKWFNSQKFQGYTFLLKGSRGMRVEKVIE